MQRENQECPHEHVISMEYYNRETGHSLVVKRNCALCKEEFPVRVEDEYHEGMVEFFNQVQEEGSPELLSSNEKE